MGKKRCAGKDPIPLLHPEVYLIQKILVWLPVVSLLRFKSVCKSWLALIESSSFIDLHTTFKSSSSSRFGSFIIHAAVEFPTFRENALLMLSSSDSECVSRSGSWYSGSFGLWSTCFKNGLCGKCDSGSGGWWWSTNDGVCAYCDKWNPPPPNNNYLGGGRGGGSNDNDEQQQQQLVLKLDNLGFPSCYQFDDKIIKPPIVMVVGSCNGLICLYDEQPNEVSLWNPATRQFRILPKPSSTIADNGDGGDVHRLFAFGFDAETKDYKVVLLSFFNRRMLNYVIDGPIPMKCICEVQVYSLSTDSWRLLKGITCLPGSPFPYPPDSSSELFYLNGFCFFMAKLLYSSEQCIPPPSPKLQDRFIISLDLTKETITPIQLPNHHYLEHLYLCYLGMKIALFTKKFAYTNDVNDPTGSWEGFHIWVFNEEHRSSSWTDVYSFEIEIQPSERNIPRGISNDGVFALLEETDISGGGLGNKKKKKKMKLYNLVTNKQVKKNFLSCDQVLSKAYAYKPSLVSINGNGNGNGSGKAVAAEMDWKCCNSRISQPMIIG